MIIICTSARSAENIARKCRGLVPNVGQSSNTPQRPKEEIAVVCLTHSQPKQSEREAVLSRKSHILVTVCVQPGSLSRLCPDIRTRCPEQTPFPLLDHLINTKGFQKNLSRLKCIVFDRADEFPKPDWLPALRDSLVSEDASYVWCFY